MAYIYIAGAVIGVDKLHASRLILWFPGYASGLILWYVQASLYLIWQM
jgi:hypothetical protein